MWPLTAFSFRKGGHTVQYGIKVSRSWASNLNLPSPIIQKKKTCACSKRNSQTHTLGVFKT